MTYKPRDNRPGFHHVVTRGNNKQRIFFNNADRRAVPSDSCAHRKSPRVEHLRVLPHAQPLSPRPEHRRAGIVRRNVRAEHCVRTRFQQVSHGRINHLFGRRYWSEYLADDRRVLNAVRYVVQNPRRAGRSGSLESYAWSSYAATIGLALSFAHLATGELLAFFGNGRDRAIARFVEFCDVHPPNGHARWQPP